MSKQQKASIDDRLCASQKFNEPHRPGKHDSKRLDKPPSCMQTLKKEKSKLEDQETFTSDEYSMNAGIHYGIMNHPILYNKYFPSFKKPTVYRSDSSSTVLSNMSPVGNPFLVKTPLLGHAHMPSHNNCGKYFEQKHMMRSNAYPPTFSDNNSLRSLSKDLKQSDSNIPKAEKKSFNLMNQDEGEKSISYTSSVNTCEDEKSSLTRSMPRKKRKIIVKDENQHDTLENNAALDAFLKESTLLLHESMVKAGFDKSSIRFKREYITLLAKVIASEIELITESCAVQT